MSDDSPEPSEAPEVPATKAARKRPAVRKSAKPKPETGGDAPAPVAVDVPVESRPEPAPRETEGEFRDGPSEPIPFTVESSSGAELPGNPKKRRRRKKKHGQGQGPGQPQHQHPHAVSPPAEAPPLPPETASTPVMHAAPRPKLDPDLVAKKAWKIFQAEVGEEGLALIDDHDAREISRRCFRLAEIFLEEAARRSR